MYSRILGNDHQVLHPSHFKSRPDQSHSSGPCEATSGFLKLFLQLYY